ncbi:hypothetical protein Tco_0621999 [Tanacetum coccineum]
MKFILPHRGGIGLSPNSLRVKWVSILGYSITVAIGFLLPSFLYPFSNISVYIFLNYPPSVLHVYLTSRFWYTGGVLEKDPAPHLTARQKQAVQILSSNKAPFRRYPECFLALVGLSPYYPFGENTYPAFEGPDRTDIGLLDYIRTADPRKVQTVEVQKGEEQVTLFDSIKHCFVSLDAPAAAHQASGSGSGVDPECDVAVVEKDAQKQPEILCDVGNIDWRATKSAPIYLEILIQQLVIRNLSPPQLYMSRDPWQLQHTDLYLREGFAQGTPESYKRSVARMDKRGDLIHKQLKCYIRVRLWANNTRKAFASNTDVLGDPFYGRPRNLNYFKNTDGDGSSDLQAFAFSVRDDLFG